MTKFILLFLLQAMIVCGVGVLAFRGCTAAETYLEKQGAK